MFIPHAKAMSPDLAGVNLMTTASFSGGGRLMFKTETQLPKGVDQSLLGWCIPKTMKNWASCGDAG
jgi:hypothetical protein